MYLANQQRRISLNLSASSNMDDNVTAFVLEVWSHAKLLHPEFLIYKYRFHSIRPMIKKIYR